MRTSPMRYSHVMIGSLLRIGMLMLLVGLAAWMALDASAPNRRLNQIDKSIAAGDFATLTVQERRDLSTTLRWLAASAGVSDRVVLNEPFGSSKSANHELHVFITTARQTSITHCDPNNAIYDPQLDALFIDQSFVSFSQVDAYLAAPEPDPQPGLDIRLTSQDFPSLRVRQRFVILHELGHRQLKHWTGLAHLWDRLFAPRHLENEADAFAIDKMGVALALASRYGVAALEPNTGMLLNFRSLEQMALRDQVQVSLVEMARFELSEQLFMPSAVSPFFQGVAHPNLVSRLSNLMDVADRQYHGSADIKAVTAFERKQLAAFDALVQRPSVELVSAHPLLGGIECHEALVLTDNLAEVFRVPTSQMQQQDRRVARIALGPYKIGTVGKSTADDRGRLWCTESGSVVLPTEGVMVTDAGHIIPWSPRPSAAVAAQLPRDIRFAKLIVSADPAPVMGIVAESGSRQWLLIVDERGEVVLLDAQTLDRDLGKFKVPTGATVYLQDAVYGDDGIYIPLLDSRDAEFHFVGYAFLDRHSARLSRVLTPMIPKDLARVSLLSTTIDATAPQRMFFVRGVGPAERVYLADVRTSKQAFQASNGRTDGTYFQVAESLDIWKFDDQAAALLTASRSLTIDDARASGVSVTRLEEMSTVPYVSQKPRGRTDSPCEIISLEAESVYQFCVAGGKLTTLFPVGGSNIKVFTAEDSVVYVVTIDGYNVFRIGQ